MKFYHQDNDVVLQIRLIATGKGNCNSASYHALVGDFKNKVIA